MVRRVNEPPATPANVWIGCWWQFDGQWCMIELPAERAAPGSVPSSGSVAEPEKEMTSPTRQVVPADGVSDRGRGGGVADA